MAKKPLMQTSPNTASESVLPPPCRRGTCVSVFRSLTHAEACEEHTIRQRRIVRQKWGASTLGFARKAK